MEESAPDRTARPLRLGRSITILMIAFVAAGTLYLARDSLPFRGSTASMCTTTRHLSAYAVITAPDIACGVIKQTKESSPITSRAELEGHIDLTDSPPDSPFTASQVGPRLPAGYEQYWIFSIRGNASISLNGKLSRGALADVVPTSESSSAPAAPPITNLLVLDVQVADAGSWIITMASKIPLNQSEATQIARGNYLLLKHSS